MLDRRLFPDLARAAEAIAARGGELGRPLHLLGETTSTNDVAKRAAKEGAPHGSTWVAESQQEGRGRQGRRWHAVPGESLLLSVLVRVRCAPARVPPLALVAGLAARDAVARAAPRADVRIKWPNDVVAVEADRLEKVAGVLVETTLTGRRIEAVVIGIGINVHTRTFPEELAGQARSVAQLASEPPDRAEILADVLHGLDRDLGLVAARGLGPVHARLTAADALRGRRVKGDEAEGVADGLDLDGRLRVRLPDGRVVRWSAGEVHLLAPSEVC